MEDFARRYVNRDQARDLFGVRADRYATFYEHADPLADALVGAFEGRSRQEAMAAFEAVLVDGVKESTVPALKAFMLDLEKRPTWYDPELMALGARTYKRLGQAAFFVLSAWSLVNGYHSAAAVKPLAFTRQLIDAMAARRLAETGKFVSGVTEEGALQRWSPGFAMCAKVRLMHAYVRWSILHSPRWKSQQWGVPINQADMVATNFEFSVLVVEGCEKLGFHFSPRERDAVVHLWRYIGFLSGINEELLREMADFERARAFAELIQLVQPGPDEDSIALTHALRNVPILASKTRGERFFAQAFTRVHDGLVWAFNGDEIPRHLGVPNRHWRHILPVIKTVVGQMEVVRRWVPGATGVATAMGRRSVENHVQKTLQGAEPTFRAA